MSKDKVFSKPLSDVKAFEFNETVTNVFHDMISRSVPGYELLLRLIGLYADVFVQDKSSVYDLGCSLGEASVIVANQTSAQDISIIAVDNSISMIDKCQQLNQPETVIEWRCDDIQNIRVENASMVLLNLTLQFINQHERQKLLDDIYQGLNPGGILVLSEKVHLDQTKENQRMVQLHQAFKKTQGYSDLEISQKRTALENVMVPDFESQLRERLTTAGFEEVYQCFRCFNFVAYLAIKV
ncbi:MAG: carboxy-S-adenosyl-L-methionine synthase CmoA [Gammaproteobacteria bacterium]|nr:carboxy-S-adenosyl-L-methionine synthase CmoA [Gammaproteobacteria bacterium]